MRSVNNQGPAAKAASPWLFRGRGPDRYYFGFAVSAGLALLSLSLSFVAALSPLQPIAPVNRTAPMSNIAMIFFTLGTNLSLLD